MHGSDGGMVTYLNEAISKAVQCEISSKASGFSSFCPRERQRQETDGQAQAQAPCRRLSMPPRRLFLALVRLCFIHHDLGISIDLFSVYVIDELLLSICTCE
ncbi:hypothetical protein FOXG_18272 [Fusarium oxysporum f. sp. lycopersici 4287]|uniref:Uncharacterized protein n=1 Tax=Fusarium oxysporum f. sp. lycopersici (strain 4287 / CBS 123668 / FGSC 9935 / NRRL 34936) TaxID=426428 RepID=A0A0J9WI11_FUSO4|nr:hypothetical protein FOXG_18272 [Fusarium oxysporum f. sp. lycopersici 4287]KNA97721.1 hypothetical protein FOXG_18272 [Fusarium oxysporum f. sp. lycopersici 4287]